jgi:phage terminase large subunit-like protein
MREEKVLLRRLVATKRTLRERLLQELSEAELRRLDSDWPAWVREGQEPPAGDDWRVWVLLGGRGFGKTRAGAEWISALARDHPGASFALVAATVDEARRVMIEGRSGLLAVARAGEEAEKILWEPSLRRLRFASGAEAFVYSGAHANALRGPEHHFAWCDELAKWGQAQDSWDNLMLSLRLGPNPRVLVTTTPRPIAALKAIIGDQGTARTGGATDANPHLAAVFVRDMERRHKGTRFGRQELDGELIEDLEGALWRRDMVEERRTGTVTSNPPLARVVVGVDPPASVEGVCGIVVCGRDEEGIGYVLADCSASGLTPEGWARKVAAAADAWGAHRVVAEANNGGRMVEAVLRGANLHLPVRLVHAADGKVARAAPVATLFESGLAGFAGRFPALEDELCGLAWGGGYQGPGRSPDRADAMVWAMTELLLGPQAPEPRVLRL